jgi:hypothetical protein
MRVEELQYATKSPMSTLRLYNCNREKIPDILSK